MLIELYGQNFGCFRDEFRLSMLATDIDRESERGIVEVAVEGDDEPLRLLRAVAIYGPNASGKSTVVRAAGALAALLADSARFTSDAPLEAFEPFLLGGHSADGVQLGVTAVVEGAVYEYRVGLIRDAVRHERLERVSGRLPGLLFERNGQTVSGLWTSDPQFSLLAQAFRPNALLLSLADALASRLAGEVALGIRRVLVMHHHSATLRPPGESAVRAASSPAFRDWLEARLRGADAGIVGLRTAPPGRAVRAPGIAGGESPARTATVDPACVTAFELVHAAGERAVALPFDRESAGTQHLIELAPLFFDLLHGEWAVAAFVDELDASTHPTLLGEMLRHFNCDVPGGARRGQLIFTAHDTILLDDEAKDAVLRRDQVYFTEKRADGSARLYSLAEFRERNNLNIRRRYLQGRYGAIPAAGPFVG